ncbi:MAG: M1 family metallopeptidase [Chloroflexi bacterium]|nr:M1 family metallopeptidase [Chloroflexota bacterium]
MTTPKFYQLPDTIRPLKYRLVLTPDLEKFTFAGEEEVEVEVLRATEQVVMNALELQVSTAWATQAGGRRIEAARIDHDEQSQTVTLTFGSRLVPGKATVGLHYTGILNDRLHGFYRSTYQGKDDRPHVMACTQFEPTDARRCLPCWDEPSIKAVFDCTLVVPAQLTAVSNTPVASETLRPDGLKVVHFEDTPLMSTYLLAFIVSELESVEAHASNGTLIRIFATPGKKELGQFALDVAVKVLAYYNDYFGVSYPLKKLDHLAIPDFAAGAMENWGAITYREVALLYDPANSAPVAKERIANVVAHEMAHMWFGDLVTMAWWNDLWLNESFASWMATKAVDHLFPEWHMWTQFIVSDVTTGMGLDGLENSHPIEQEVKDPSEINQLFDAISYDKGASILRMLEQFIGPDDFRAGLRQYIAAHTYDNAQGQDLWQAMEDASAQPIVSMMGSWIEQAGYPVVQAKVRRTSGKWQVSLRQDRFLYSGIKDDPTLWQVPVSVISQGGAGQDQMVMSSREATLRMEKGTPRVRRNAWVKLNPAYTAFYRTQYEEKEWARLIPGVETRELSPADRLGLHADTYALSRARMIPATQYLRLVEAYKGEDDYVVWSDVVGDLRAFDGLLTQESYSAKYQTLARSVLRRIVRKMGWEAKPNEGHLDTLLRSTVLGAIGTFGDRATQQEATRRFMRYLEDPKSLSPDLKGVVYGLAAQAGDTRTYEAMHNLAKEEQFQEERLRLYGALARFSTKPLLEKTLELSLSSEVRSQDTVSLLTQVAMNRRNGLRLTWDFMKENWQELERRYGAGGFGMMRLVSIPGGFASPEERQEVADFYLAHRVPSATRTIQQTLERIDLNTQWLQHNRLGVKRWFEQRSR